MGYRKVPLIESNIYHVYTRSIAEFRIFRSEKDYQRMVETMYYYLAKSPPCKFSTFLRLLDNARNITMEKIDSSEKIVSIIGYCIMPTHIHLILKQIKEEGISKYMNLVLKSYGKYFNIKYERHGPLYEGRFKNVIVETDEQFQHLTRYIHLNPVSASLVKDPSQWKYSSYREYLNLVSKDDSFCEFSEYLNLGHETYKDFVLERIDYQRELQKIKHLLIE